MGCLLLPAIIGLLALADTAIVRMFRRRQAGTKWWAALTGTWLTGAALGTWASFFLEYQPSPRLRVFGAPVPVAVFHWEGPPGDEEWVDFVTSAPLLVAASNVAILALLAACPVGVVFWLARRRPSEEKSGEPGPAADRPRE